MERAKESFRGGTEGEMTLLGKCGSAISSSLKRPNKAVGNGQSLTDRTLTGKVDDITEGMENGLI